MPKVYVVWYDGFQRQREDCTLISRENGTLTFKDSEGEEFTITEEQLVLMR